MNTAAQIDTVAAQIFAQGRKQPTAPAYYVRERDGWKATSWADYAGEVRRAARALIALGLPAGGTTAILGYNRPEWVIFNVASMAAGAAPAGIYTTNSPTEVQYIIGHAESAVVLVENQGQYDKVRQVRDKLPTLTHIVLMKGAERIAAPDVLSWEDFLAKGGEQHEAELEKRLAAAKPNDLATLIYTSGTTGPPKGVMLSHDNLVFTARVALQITDVGPSDCALSYLPLSHIAEQMFSVHVAATAGYAVYYAESIDKVPDNLKEVQPTVFFGVPRIWEKFYAGVSAKMKEATGVKASLVAWARGIGTKASLARANGRPLTGLDAMQYALANKLVFSKLKPAIGLGRARVMVSGAAPIAPDVLQFFASLDLLVQEVYGQSEGCGPTSFNRVGQTLLGSVGPAIPEVEVRIADDGEVCARGRNIFLGYYKDQAATDETLVDGWMLSGDLGRIDEQGYLHITGRKKDILITAGGKNIAPRNLEEALKTIPMVNEAVVIGDRRKYLTALLTLDPVVTEARAAELGCAPTEVGSHPTILAEIQATLDQVNQQFARVEQIKKFRVLPRNLSIDDGELTPTLKIKRRFVYQNFADLIESMYAEDGGE